MVPQFKAGNIVVIVGYDLAPKGIIPALLNDKIKFKKLLLSPVELKDIINEIQSALSAVLKWAADRGSK